jgi:hypothetical protein
MPLPRKSKRRSPSAQDIGCVDRGSSDQIADQCRYVGRMINRLMTRLDASG